MGKFMTPRTGKGKELQELLRKELGIPESTKWFSVRFAVDEVVSVTCEYLPQENTQPALADGLFLTSHEARAIASACSKT